MIKSGRAKVASLLIIAATIPLMYWAFNRAEAREPRRIGPYTCVSCNKDYPVATENDLREINYQNHFLKTDFFDDSKGPADSPGDVIIICSSICVDWKMTTSRSWEGTNARARGKLPGGAGGGSGSRGGGGTGGANPGSGCYGNCGGGGSGVVTIKPIIPVRPK